MWIEPIAEHRQGVVHGISMDENELRFRVHLVEQTHVPIVLQAFIYHSEALVLIDSGEFFEVSAGHLIQEVGINARRQSGIELFFCD